MTGSKFRTALLVVVAAGWALLALVEAVRGDVLGLAIAVVLHVAAMARLWSALRRPKPAG